jgi:hypothetical protein
MTTRAPRLFLLTLALSACSTGGGRPLDGSAPEDVGTRRDASFADRGFEVCEVGSASAEPLPVTLMVQVDTSGSMNCLATERGCAVDDPQPGSRWDVFRGRLNEALGSLPDSARAGLMHYPAPESSCAPATPLVPIGPLSTSRAQIASAMDALTPTGITPTHDAVVHALEQLRAAEGEDRYLVLATDGQATVCVGCDPGCSFDALDADNEQMVETIRASAAMGIPTFVIGVPGSQGFRRILSRMASAGETERAPGCSSEGPTYCHYDLTDESLDFATGLRDALASIGEAVLSCEYEIPPNPDGAFDPTLVNVRVVREDGAEEVVPRDPARHDGWDYSDDGARIVIHGEPCERARALRGGRIDVLFGCATLLI